MGFLTSAVEEGDVDSPAFIIVLKFDDISFVKQIGIEYDSPILAIGNCDGFGSSFLQEILNLVAVFVVVVFGKIPIVRCFLIPHDQPPIVWITVTFVGG